jgi:metallo-beta-lactamase family protein
MKITFCGAARTVTGSSYLLDINGQKLLLECGLFQGRRNDTYQRNLNFQFRPNEVAVAILSHAHIDHSGNLPNLVKHGYRGPIYATSATADLADVMLRDSGHIQEADAIFVNKRRALQNLPPVQPLYTVADAERVAPLFRPMNYDQTFQPLSGVTARLVDAGHILGSAAIVLDVQENGRRFRFWFSGDIGREGMPLIKDPVLPADADYVMMECTYGDVPHLNPQAAFDQFRDVIVRTVKRGGKAIVPAFAVGRTQELVYSMHRMRHTGQIPNVPIYVDSPLAVEASDIFQKHPECFDEETHRFSSPDKHPALSFDQLHYVRNVDESKALNGRPGPMVIISASGMAESGRILHHLRNNIEDSRNTIVIVSWQAPDTLGRRLVEGAHKVRIFGEEFIRRAEVVVVDGLSAHAGQNTLLEYALAAQKQVKRIILVHGEEGPEQVLQEKLASAGAAPVTYPALNDTLEL